MWYQNDGIPRKASDSIAAYLFSKKIISKGGLYNGHLDYLVCDLYLGDQFKLLVYTVEMIVVEIYYLHKSLSLPVMH